MRILLADDEADIRDSTKMLLEMQGHHVELAADGAEALQIAAQRVPDVVFMDMRMPVMDGITATRSLRSNPRTKHVPIVCISAYLHQSDWRDKAIEAGCDDCLSKPVDMGRLQLILSRYAREQIAASVNDLTQGIRRI